MLVPTGGAAAATKPSGSWAGPEIRTVAAAGLMGATDAATFRGSDRLTAQTLENLVFGLKQVVFPPDPTPQPPVPPPPPNPAVPAPTTPGSTTPTLTTPAPPPPTTPTTTTPTATTTTPTTTTPLPPPAPPTPRHPA